MKPYVISVAASQETLDAVSASEATKLNQTQVDARVEAVTGQLSNLTTTAKTNLVAAINEAAASGGSGGGQVYDVVGHSTQNETLILWLAEEGSTTPITTAPAAGSRIVMTEDGATMDFVILDVVTAPAAAGGDIAMCFYDATGSSIKTVMLGTGAVPEEDPAEVT